jgi:hypothetical protein
MVGIVGGPNRREAEPMAAASKTGHGATNDPNPESAPRATAEPSAVDPIEAALARAVEQATAAGQWTIVAQLATELQARRCERLAGRDPQ